MEPLLVSTALVALAEMGDKTQLLSLVLAVRFKKPLTIVLGIFLATALNHALAGALGAWIGQALSPELLPWGLAISFFAMALWMLVPDQLGGDEARAAPRLGVLLTTVTVFFLAEMGDKTQVATIMLAARYESFLAVVAGTTLGMLLANAPVVWLGERITRRVPLKLVHRLSAGVFAVLGVLALVLPR